LEFFNPLHVLGKTPTAFPGCLKGRGGGDATGARQLQNATTLLPFGLSQTFHSIFPPPQVKMGKIELTQWRLADGIHFIFDLTSFSSVFPIFFLCPPLCVAIVCEFVAI